MNKEWGTPISKDKIISRRNKLVEWQKIGELRFTPLYEIIDENILDINYMIYEINRLKNIINEAKEECKSVIGNPEHTIVSKNELMKLMLNILNKGDSNE